ncbi:dihydrofolate reductase family protein [Amycolatopsis kentuckyensis]|uniref:dihydrofolate reductase family protein n=1 Tax=Amycolatopsis kentuckyensis TaxID=218823 RepID=UPI0035628AF2
MGKIIISENITLDGIVEDPTGDKESARWFTRIGDDDRAAWAEVEYAEAVGAAALLMGRRTHSYFLDRGWASRTGEWADRLRALPKYVVSSSAVEDAGWGEATVLAGDVVKEVAKLKEEVDGEIVVYGSGTLVRTLLEHDLADELRLMTYPFVVGTGARLFPEAGGVKPARLSGARPVGTALVLLTYELIHP